VLIYPGVQPANIVVTKDTPPAFMLCANDDAGPSNAIPVLAQALKKAECRWNSHIQSRRPRFWHPSAPASDFELAVRLQEWMEDSGILPKKTAV